ncbi:hypothetical protein TeGR_g14451, partial [Tetraparma gracilis]
MYLQSHDKRSTGRRVLVLPSFFYQMLTSDNGSWKFTDSDVGLKDCYDTVSKWHDDVFG